MDYPIQGHRGARGLLPENTIPSFLKCLELGVYIFEFDVVVSQDKQVVVSHEEWMHPDYCSRPDGKAISKSDYKQHLLYQMPYQKIKQYDCGRRGNPRFPAQIPLPAYKPLLSEVIEACDHYTQTNNLPSVTYNIEIKTSGPKGDNHLHPEPAEFAQLVHEVIQNKQIEKRVITQSFDPRIVQEMKKRKVDFPLSLLVDNTDSLAVNLERLGFIPNIYAPFYHLITKEMIEEAHEKGMQLITWTVNDFFEMKRLLALGVDAIITDYPNLKQVLANYSP